MLRSLLLSGALLAPIALASSSIAACGSGDIALGSQADSQNTSGGGSTTDAGSSCAAAGGTCYATGGIACASHAPSSVDDCNPELLPSGAFCCLDPAADGGTGNESAADGSAGLPACAMAPNVEPLDASSTAECTAARTLLVCDTLGMGTSNAGEVCLSDDPTTCPDLGGAADASDYACSDQCADDEYAVACGFGQGTPPTPPDWCHGGEAAPSGTVYYCCPCGG